jgi:hypothetical protein
MKTPHIVASLSRRRFIGQLSATAALALLPRAARALDGSAPPKRLGIVLVGLGNYATNQLAPAIAK